MLAGLVLHSSGPLYAQALNEEIVRLLNGSCGVLVGNRAGPLDPNDFGPGLISICEFPSTGNGSSFGGGTGSVQSSTTSIHNSVLQRRLERAKRPQQKGTTQTTRLSGGGANVSRRDYLLETMYSEGSISGEGGESETSSRRFDLFASGAFESLDRNATRFEDGYDSSIAGVTLGADFRFTDTFVAGFVATSNTQNGDFDGGGDFEIKTLLPTLFASILPTKQTFIQIVVGRGDQEFDVTRNVRFTADRMGVPVELRGAASSETDGRNDSGGAQFGYDCSVRNLTFGPRVGVNYSKTTIDRFVEGGGTGLELRVAEHTVKSVQGVAGFYGSMAVSGKSGVFLPQIGIEYVHEFEDSASLLNAQFSEDLRGPGATTFSYQTNNPDSGFFNVDVGAAAVFAHGIQPYINLRAMLGNTHFDSLSGTFGVRFEL